MTAVSIRIAGSARIARCFVGQLDTHVLVEPTGSVPVFGACFHPDGASAFARWPLHETAGRILPLDDVWGGAARSLEDTIRNASADAHRIAAAESFQRERLRAPDRPVRHAIELMLREPWRGVAAIAEEMGSSTRSLERAFLDRVGCPPKTFARIARFQRALALRETCPQWRWARVAVESGYYDQAHLISDFHQFSGMTPALNQDDLTEIEMLFLRARR